jgi:hypothetical protein
MPTELMSLEPRTAGEDVVEPAVSFESNVLPLREVADCFGCCINFTQFDISTRSSTQ